jgi:hypothetical protein
MTILALILAILSLVMAAGYVFAHVMVRSMRKEPDGGKLREDRVQLVYWSTSTLAVLFALGGVAVTVFA